MICNVFVTLHTYNNRSYFCYTCQCINYSRTYTMLKINCPLTFYICSFLKEDTICVLFWQKTQSIIILDTTNVYLKVSIPSITIFVLHLLYYFLHSSSISLNLYVSLLLSFKYFILIILDIGIPCSLWPSWLKVSRS